MDPISTDALTVLRALLERDHGEDDLPPGASIAMLQYLVALGYAACQTWEPPHPDSPYRDLAQGYVAYAITEKGREYIRLKDEEAQPRQQHASPDTQKIEKKSFGTHLLLTSLADCVIIVSDLGKNVKRICKIFLT